MINILNVAVLINMRRIDYKLTAAVGTEEEKTEEEEADEEGGMSGEESGSFCKTEL